MEIIENFLNGLDSERDSLAFLVALLGLMFGLWQYYRAQVWEKAKAAHEELRRLEEDEYLSLACLILDWKARKMPVPVALRPIVENSEIFTHSEGLLKRALVQKEHYQHEELIYRDTFDRFFTYLERIDHGIDRNIFNKQDLLPLRHWLNQVFQGKYHPPEVFADFIEEYQFFGVEKLHAKFKVLPRPKSAVSSGRSRPWPLLEKQATSMGSTVMVTGGQAVKDSCEAHWEANKNNCSGYVRSVANDFSIVLTGQADAIVDQIQTSEWSIAANGVEAQRQADAGKLVIAGLKSADHKPPADNGHVVVVVAGPLAHGKYPSSYWGTLGGVGKKNTTLNYAWNAESRDLIIYRFRSV